MTEVGSEAQAHEQFPNAPLQLVAVEVTYPTPPSNDPKCSLPSRRFSGRAPSAFWVARCV